MSSSSAAPEAARALRAARRYTRGRVRSTQELRTYLQRRGVPPQAARQIVAECTARGLLDDGACARLWAEHWTRQGYAWERIRSRLSAKGLDAQLIERAAGGEALRDQARARALVAQRLHAGSGRPDRARLARMLVARGFDEDLIEHVLSELIGSRPSD